MSVGRIIFEMEMFPETTSDPVGRRYVRVTVDGTLRSAAVSVDETPTNAAAILATRVYQGEPVIVLANSAATARLYGWLQSDEGIAESIYSNSTNTVDMSGRSNIDTSEQQSGSPDINKPTGWFPSGVRGVVAMSPPFDSDHELTMWYVGNSTALSLTLLEFEENSYTVTVETSGTS